jgi:uncharacterized membrane protein YccC
MRQRWFRRHVSRAAQLTATRPSYANGIRAAISTIFPIVAGLYFGWHSTPVWMGLAGFNTSLADRGGAFRTRVAAMSAAAFFGMLAAGSGAIAGHSVPTAVLVMAVWCLGAGLARTWGLTATSVGVISVATFIVSIGIPAARAGEAWERGGAVAAGSAFAMAVALLIWPIRLFRPARLAVARAYRALASAALSADDARVPEQALLREQAREAIDEARMTLAGLRRGLQGESSRGERLLILTETADRILSLLDGNAGNIAWLLDAIASSVERERSASIRLPDGLDVEDDLRQALAEGVRAAADLDETDWRLPSLSTLRLRYVSTLAATFSWESAVLRHALRVAVAGGAAVALTEHFHVTRGYWMTLTVIIILQPYTSATFLKGVQRVIGTILGGVVAAVLVLTIHNQALMLTLVFVGAAVTVAFLRVNYALYSLFLTPTFILLAELNAVDRHLVAIRIGNTLIGALIAYAAAWLLWPASERGLAREELSAALHALADYTRCVECDEPTANESRRAVLVALQNADASLQRLVGDARNEEIEPLMAVLIYTRRYLLALNALQTQSEDRLRLAPLARFAARALTESAGAIAEHRPPKPVAEDEAPAIGGAERLVEPLLGIERAAARL